MPSLGVILSAAAFGLLADKMDHKVILFVAMLIYAAGGVWGALANTIPQILMGRLILGVGVAGTMTLTTVLAADLWRGQARAKFMGKQGAASGIGGIVFLMLGGYLASFSWRGPFLVYAIALPLALLAYWIIPRKTSKRSNADITQPRQCHGATWPRSASLRFLE